MGTIAKMIRDDALVEVAEKMLQRGASVDDVVADTGLDESTVRDLQVKFK